MLHLPQKMQGQALNTAPATKIGKDRIAKCCTCHECKSRFTKCYVCHETAQNHEMLCLLRKWKSRITKCSRPQAKSRIITLNSTLRFEMCSHAKIEIKTSAHVEKRLNYHFFLAASLRLHFLRVCADNQNITLISTLRFSIWPHVRLKSGNQLCPHRRTQPSPRNRH